MDETSLDYSRGKNKKFNGRGKSHFKLKKCGQTLSPPLGSVLSQLASGRLLAMEKPRPPLSASHVIPQPRNFNGQRTLFHSKVLQLTWTNLTSNTVHCLSNYCGLGLTSLGHMNWGHGQVVSARKRSFWSTDAVKIKIINVHYNDTIDVVDFF